MKYFNLQDNELINHKGTRFYIDEIREDEDHELHAEIDEIVENAIDHYRTIQHPQCNETFIAIYEDGSIFLQEGGEDFPIFIKEEEEI